MKKPANQKLLLVAAILIVVSLIIDYAIFRNQNEQIFIDEESYLYHLAHSIDYNIDATLSSRSLNLRVLHKRSQTRSAERTWMNNGNAEPLLDYLEEYLSDSNYRNSDILVIRGGNVVLSTGDRTDYDFSGFTASGNISPCTDSDGVIHLCILTDADEYGFALAELINLPTFYNQIVSHGLAEDNWTLLLDSDSQIMVHHQNNRVLADPIDAVTGATCGPDGIRLIEDIQSGGISDSGLYDYWDAENEQEHRAYLSVIPSAETKNGYFAVGVAGQIDDRIAASNRNMLIFIAASIVFMIGIVMIIWKLRKQAVVEKEHLEELEVLRMKNEEMESLAQKHSELAHLDRLETIGTLTSGISHEFNNLLTPIMAYSVMALERIPEDDEELGDYVEEIYGASKKAKRIISRLSDLSRKNTEDIFRKLDVKDLIVKASDSAMPAKPKEIGLFIDAPDDLYVNGNELQLHQMLLNLILNAYQAMGNMMEDRKDDGRSFRLDISAEKTDGEILISVADNGPGIPEEVRGMIFDPFFTTKGSGKGTGLGLPICRQAASDHQGRIELESETGRGTTFRVYIPEYSENAAPDETSDNGGKTEENKP